MQDNISKQTGTGGTTGTGGMTGMCSMSGNGGIDRTADKSNMSLRVVTMEGRIYVRDPHRIKIQEHFHDNAKPGHVGTARMQELVAMDFFFHGMEGSVRNYVAQCHVCQCVQAPRHPKYGMNMPIQLQCRPWKGSTMDFVTDLPESMSLANTEIEVIVYRLKKYAIYLHYRKDIDEPELVRLCFEQVSWQHIITDHVMKITSSPTMACNSTAVSGHRYAAIFTSIITYRLSFTHKQTARQSGKIS